MTTAEKLLKIDEGVEETIALNVELEQTLYGTDTGGKSHYDEFWDAYQDNGNRLDYGGAFYGNGWNNKTFNPKYSMFPTNCAYMFRGCESTVDLEQLLCEKGITLDTSNATGFSYCFSDSKLTALPTIDLTNCATNGIAYAFYGMKAVSAKLIVASTTPWGGNVFNASASLENLIIEGIIGTNGLNVRWSTKLSKASITSIINALSTTTSGLTVTLSKTAVNNAFETSAGAADGSTSAEWLALIGARSNWTISLV